MKLSLHSVSWLKENTLAKWLFKLDLKAKSVVKLMAHARSMCDPRKSYLVTGGLGGFDLELAHWLVERGARHLVLTSRRGQFQVSLVC